MAEAAGGMDVEREEGAERDLEEPLLKRSPSLTTSHLAMVGAKVSHMESLDYEIIENDLFQHDWRSRSRGEVLQYVFLKWTLAFLVGLLTGGVASLINLAVENIAGAKMIAVTRLVGQQRYLAGVAYLTGTNLALTAVAAVLCVGIAPTAAGPGIPEIKAYLNGVDTPNMFGASTLFVKIVGSIGAVAAGLDLGKEGPLVHIGTCIAALLGQGGGGAAGGRRRWRWLRFVDNDRDRRDLITLGASSGVCAAFRAPVGGVLFALEEVATWWRSALLWRTFFSTAVVVVVLRGFTELCNSGSCGLFGRGGLILFDVGEVQVTYHAVDLLPVVAIGVIGGLLGSLYNFLLHKVLRLYSLINEKGRAAKLILSLSVSIFTSVCVFSLPFLGRCTPCDAGLPAGVCPTTSRAGKFKQFNCAAGHYNDLASLLQSTNDDAVRHIFSATAAPAEYSAAALLVFFALYCVLGLFTFGIAVPSGLFLPIILMGSGYGRLLGLAMRPYTHLDQGLYAVLGAAALMAGSMRMTVSLCVIFLELTNNLLLLPITMIVLLIAKTVGDVFNPSIYEIILELKGLPFLEPNPEPWMRNLTVGELAAAKPAVVSLSGVERVGRLLEVLNSTTHNGFPVVDHRAKAPPEAVAELHGLVLRSHIIAVLRKKWFLGERRRTEEWEARERFTSEDLAERRRSVGDLELTAEEKEMFVDLHPFTNMTPHTVVETMSATVSAVAPQIGGPFAVPESGVGSGALASNDDMDSISAKEEEGEEYEEEEDEDEEGEEDQDSMRTFTAARLEGQNAAGVAGGGGNPRSTKPPKSENPSAMSGGGGSEISGKDDRGAAGQSSVGNAGGASVKEEAAKGIFTDNLQTSGAYCAREEGLKREEDSGRLKFLCYANDGIDEHMIWLIGLKNIFARQLPNMPKEYIARLVMDRNHKSMMVIRNNIAVGGITYRPYKSQRFGEIAFCAIRSGEQLKGYGTRVMNHLKQHARDVDGLTHFLTYADNNAVAYFIKQGFTKEITFDKERWQGYLKDYDGGLLMECKIDQKLPYIDLSTMIRRQRQAIDEKIRELSNCHIIYPGIDFQKKEAGIPRQPIKAEDIPGLREAGWTPDQWGHSRFRPSSASFDSAAYRQSINAFMRQLLKLMNEHTDAWPFKEPVDARAVPDYYDIIKDPVDLRTMSKRVESEYYVTLEMFVADVKRMFANARTYNTPETIYYKCATRLEAHFTGKFHSEFSSYIGKFSHSVRTAPIS